jgi:hypothetical protein
MGISWWRMAFIFGPAIARGDISSFSLYTPFIFGERTRVPRQRAAPACRSLAGGRSPRARRRARGDAGEPSLGRGGGATAAAGVPDFRRGVPRPSGRAGCGVRVAAARLQRGAPASRVHRQCNLPSHAPGRLPRALASPAAAARATPAAGHLLSRTVRKWKDKVKLRGWPHKVPALFSASRAAAHPLPRSPPMPVRLPVHSPCMALTPTVQHSAAVPRMFGPAGIHAQHPSSVQASAPCVSLRGEGATATSTPVRAACPLCEQHLRSAFPDVTTCLGVPFSPSPRARAGVERGHE